MIKQDNRLNKPDEMEQRLLKLKALLDDDENQNVQNEQEDKKQKNKGKKLFISVKGDNNIFSIGKSKNIISELENKKKFIFIISLAFLFF